VKAGEKLVATLLFSAVKAGEKVVATLLFSAVRALGWATVQPLA
jgi:hypothetical protein